VADQRLRDLERQAASGDPNAAERLAREVERAAECNFCEAREDSMECLSCLQRMCDRCAADTSCCCGGGADCGDRSCGIHSEDPEEQDPSE